MSELGKYVSSQDAIKAYAKSLEGIKDAVEDSGIRGYATVVVHGDGSVSTCFYAGDVYFPLLGGLSETHGRLLINNFVDEDEDDT